MNPTTRIQGQGITSLTANVKVTIEPKNKGQERTQFVVTNMSSLVNDYIVYICSTDGSEALPVFARESKTLETDSPFRIYCANAVDVIVGELFLRGVRRDTGGGSGAGAGGGGGGDSDPSRPYGSVGLRPAQLA